LLLPLFIATSFKNKNWENCYIGWLLSKVKHWISISRQTYDNVQTKSVP